MIGREHFYVCAALGGEMVTNTAAAEGATGTRPGE